MRVANALGDLPKISASFEKGELSYSKVRAMTRVAMPDNEDFLLNIAHHGTAHHMESLVSKYSRVKRLHENKAADEQYQDRSLKYYYDDDGSFVIKGRFPAEQGALILKALQLAVEQRNAPVARDNADVTAETPDIDVTAETPGLDVTAETREPVSARRADALAEMAESYLASGPSSSSSADRYQVMLHVSAATLKDGITKDNITAETSNPMDEQISHIEDGPHVSAETSRRICCDTGVSPIMTNNDGEPLSIGRKSWTRSACCFQIRVHRHLSH